MSTQSDQPVGPSSDAAEAVKLPAIGLMVTAGVGLVAQLLGIVMNLAGIGMGAAAAPDSPEAAMNMLSGTVGLVTGGIGIVIGIVIFIGATKMKKLESYGFSMAATILAMIPCLSPCCLLGLPIGIWALIVLMKPEVKSSFS